MKVSLWIGFLLMNLLGGNVAYSNECNFNYLSEYNKKEGVYLLKEKYGKDQRCVYEESDSDNALLKIAKKIDFNITIHISEGEVYSDVNIKNLSVKGVYIWRGDLYSYGNQLSGDFFNIITDTIRLQYLGAKVNFGASPELVSDYIVIAPGEEVNERIKLNAYYQFLPGNHRYDIGTVYIACTYTPGVRDGYLSESMGFWIRSNRIKIVINGDEINEKLAQSYTVK